MANLLRSYALTILIYYDFIVCAGAIIMAKDGEEARLPDFTEHEMSRGNYFTHRRIINPGEFNVALK